MLELSCDSNAINEFLREHGQPDKETLAACIAGKAVECPVHASARVRDSPAAPTQQPLERTEGSASDGQAHTGSAFQPDSNVSQEQQCWGSGPVQSGGGLRGRHSLAIQPSENVVATMSSCVDVQGA